MFHNTQAVCHSMPSQSIHPSVHPFRAFRSIVESGLQQHFIASLHASLSCKFPLKFEERPCCLETSLAQSMHDLIGLLLRFTPSEVAKQPSAATVDPSNLGAYNLQQNLTLRAPQNSQHCKICTCTRILHSVSLTCSPTVCGCTL